MDNRTPIHVYDAEGQLIGMVTGMRAATILISCGGAGSTIWFGSGEPQLVYTADDNNWRYIDRFDAEAILSEALVDTWIEHEAVYKSEAVLMGEKWWEDFKYFVWSDSANRLQDEEDAYDKKEEAENLNAIMRRMVRPPAETESVDDDNSIRYDEDSLTYKAFGPSPGSNN